MSAPQPYAYLRKSRVLRGQEVISPEMQLAAATAYAEAFGDQDLIVLTDLNRSGRKGRRERPGFDALLSAIEAGEVSAVYSYSLSRLSRSVRDIMALAELCKAQGVAIRLARDTDPDPTTATGRAVLALLGVMAQLEADLASERALDAVEARRARGDVMGTPVFADHHAVIAAYREAGSYTGAAKLLTACSIPTRNGNQLWHPSAVQVILTRVAPEMLPVVSRRGVKAAAPFIFYRLVQCWCERTMTGWRRASGPQVGYVSYRCTRGRLDPGHGTTTVPEGRLLAFAMDEATRLRPPSQRFAHALGDQTELHAQLDRIRVAWVAGLYRDEAAMMVEKAEVDDALTQLDLAGRARSVPMVTWGVEPRLVNRELRAIWGAIHLDRAMWPLSVDWLLPPEWLHPPRPRGPGSLVGQRAKPTTGRGRQ
jgi:DNA invertase Pin-like site-specific DNA recombinase